MSKTEIVLLGTAGGPRPSHARRGIASALVIGERTVLIDAGRDACTQYHASGLRYDALSDVFITHLHSDHVCGLFDFFQLAAFGPAGDVLNQRVSVHGPGSAGELPPIRADAQAVPVVCPEHPVPGLRDHLELQIAASAYDLNVRMRCSGMPDVHELMDVREIEVPEVGASATRVAPIMEPWVIAEDDDMRVSAILVDHPQTYPSLGYRFDTDAGSIVFAGDTTGHPNVVRLARGADALVLSPVFEDFFMSRDSVHGRYMTGIHVGTEDAGRVADEAEVACLILTHLAPSDPGLVTSGQWRERVARRFDGRIVVGEDLMRLNLGSLVARPA